jgi:hypothetical protein
MGPRLANARDYPIVPVVPPALARYCAGMKLAPMAVLLLAVSPAALAQAPAQTQTQVTGSDEEVYAMLIAALENCEAAVPAGKADYAKVRRSFNQIVQKNPNLAKVPNSPTLKATLAEARTAVDSYITRNGKEVVCDQLKEGVFGPIKIPVGP